VRTVLAKIHRPDYGNPEGVARGKTQGRPQQFLARFVL
jgi:hypothetical protein